MSSTPAPSDVRAVLLVQQRLVQLLTRAGGRRWASLSVPGTVTLSFPGSKTPLGGSQGLRRPVTSENPTGRLWWTSGIAVPMEIYLLGPLSHGPP